MIEKTPLSKVNPEYSRRHESMADVDRRSLRAKGAAGIPEDSSLDASHVRMRESLAAQVSLVHQSAQKGGLSSMEIGLLADLANIWRILVSNEPAPSLEDLSEEELRAKLDAVKRRGK